MRRGVFAGVHELPARAVCWLGWHGGVAATTSGKGVASQERFGRQTGGLRSVSRNSIGGLVVDIRGFNPALRRALVFTLVDKLIELDSDDQLVLVCDHEPAGLGYQIDLRRETRGRFEFSYDKRSDGAWVALIRPRSVASARETR